VLSDFEVINIVDDRNPYYALLWIYWAIDMNGVINLKKCKVSFDKKSLCVIIPLDTTVGLCYAEPVHDYESDDHLDYIYNIMGKNQDWVNPTTDGQIAWEWERS